ncbi:MAG TPA: hypothetical protein VK849_13675 [Longimicrobiales bacterium]|nr:hypothetical protein [Longimicrobiales bacterium]
MSTNRFLTVVLSILATTACNPFRGGQAVEMSAGDATLNTRWHANLASPASLAGAVQMSGSASMAPDPDGTSTVITLSLANATPGGLHPWAAHQGRCGTGMDYGVFGSSDKYERVEVDSDGHASGQATVPLTTLRSGDYFVAVYASEANSGMVVACGNLAPPTR